VTNAVNRVARAWRALAGEQRLAGVAALILLGTLLLPWYRKSFFVAKGRSLASANDTITGFGSADFVLASIVLVAFGVLALLFFRGEKRGFHLPGGDGLVVLVAGGWTAFLTFYRIVDPISVHGQGATVGIQWGVFISFLAAALLAYAGLRMQAAHRPEPPLPAVRPDPPTPAQPARRRRTTAAAQAADDRPTPGQLRFDEAETQVSHDREERPRDQPRQDV
jgi:hypothetical protein